MFILFAAPIRNRGHSPPGYIERRSDLPLAAHLLWRSLLLVSVLWVGIVSAQGQSAGDSAAAHQASTDALQLAGTPTGASRCLTCHPDEVAGYARSAMAHSLRRPAQEPDGTVSAHGSKITMYSTPAGYWQRWENGGDRSEYHIEWVVGSGNHASGYLLDIGGHLFQSPVAYYQSRQAYDLAPGYENQPDPDFTRPIREECVLCHSGNALHVSDTLNEYRAPVFPRSEEAITCERCHGPAEKHLAEARAGNIVNPAKLEPAARDSICEQCHLFGVARVPNPGMQLSDFVPGQRAEDVFTTYHDVNPTGSFKVISHVEQLALSACARHSHGRLWCGTCHDPHNNPRGDSRNDPRNDPNRGPLQPLAYYRAVCLTCHAAKFPTAATHPAKDSDCLSCHMPRREAKDGGHSAFTDHRIQRRPKAQPEAPADAGIAAWREPSPDLRARNLGIAYIGAGMQRKSSQFIVQGYRTLTEVQAQFADDSDFFRWIGEALLLAQQTSEAKIAFERALELDPHSPLAEASAASPYVQSGDSARAIAHLERALALDSLYLPAASTLMSLYQKEGSTAEADALAGKIKAAMDDAPEAEPAASQYSASESGKTAEQVYKNIQILKGVPAGQVIPAMQFITASLGVECSYCHVEGHLEKDDKKPKQVARDMLQMTFALNKNNFEGHREVTCYSCHRGAPNPLSIPLVGGQSQPASAALGYDAATPKLPANLPTVSQLLENYVRALGGSAAIEKITTRVEKGTTTFHGQSQTVEIFTQAPDKQSIVRHISAGQSVVTTFNGQAGWSIAPDRPLREMHDADLAAARLDADLQFPLHIRQLFPELRVEYPEKVNDRDAYLLVAIREGQPPIKLYFDEQSSLLVRIARYAETPLGRNPTQIDYADYREVDGVEVPFRVTTSQPANTSKIQFESVQQNVTIEAMKFAKPKPLPPLDKQSEQSTAQP